MFSSFWMGWTAPPAEYGGNPANSSVFVDKAVNQIITAAESAMGE